MSENSKPTGGSFLQRVQSEYEKTKDNRCHRLTFFAKIHKKTNRQKLEKFHVNLFSNADKSTSTKHSTQNKNIKRENSEIYQDNNDLKINKFKKNEEKITGSFIIVNNDYVLHTFEYFAETKLQKYLYQLNQQNFFESSRVLSVIEYMPREYQGWFHRSCTIPPNPEDRPDQEEQETVILSCIQSLVELGNQLSIKSDFESANRLFISNAREILNKIPSIERLRYILEIDLLFRLDNYYNLLFKSWDFELSSEFLYPSNAHPVETYFSNEN